MAVLHHAFRCPMTPDLKQDISSLLAAWERGDREWLSATALAEYAALGDRKDIRAAFSLNVDGPAVSWLQPEHISPGLAALVTLASHFIAVPTLSRSHDTNHHLLETQLPLLSWSLDEVGLLVHGQPIETMLANYTSAPSELTRGGFRHTGGWASSSTARTLAARLDELTAFPTAKRDEKSGDARRKLDARHALDDARAMLAAIEKDDWLVTAITH